MSIELPQMSFHLLVSTAMQTVGTAQPNKFNIQIIMRIGKVQVRIFSMGRMNAHSSITILAELQQLLEEVDFHSNIPHLPKGQLDSHKRSM